ncbi:unnamed protein product, partial [Aphanomyces euteiches]
MIDDYEKDFGTSILADLLRDRQFPRLLSYFANQSENPRVKSALETLGKYFNPRRVQKLQLETPPITLDDHVRCKLNAASGEKQRGSIASDGWRPTPAQLDEIPSSIVAIVDSVSGVDAGREKLLTQRLGEFWAVTMAELHKRSLKNNDRVILHRIEDLASKLQWSSEEMFTRTLNAHQVRLFAHGIESILAPKTSSATVNSAKEDPVWRSTFLVNVDTSGKKSISHVQTSRVISSTSSLLDTLLHTLVHRLDVRGALYPNVVVNDDDSSDEEVALVRLLSLPSADERIAGVMHLERFLHQRSEEPQEHRAISEKDRGVASVCGEDKYVLSRFGASLAGNIHIYAANPAKPPLLANLAAQHLLDGFPLEMMDGDAGAVNVVWIQGVLEALSDVLGSATVLVLSILGIQSSGKSTLFNVMFGVRLQTGVGRCTRGVSMQLIKCEGHNEYEYILLLDTEGVRAPDFIGLEG